MFSSAESLYMLSDRRRLAFHFSTGDKGDESRRDAEDVQTSHGNILPVIQAVDVLVLIHVPSNGHVCHANLLALVDKGRASLQTEKDGNELGACFSMFGLIVGKSTHGAGLVVVLQVQCIPAVVVVHEALPLVDYCFELG